MAKKVPTDYVRPATTDKAFNFGRTNALHGSTPLSYAEVVPDEHPFPGSIWRAYKHGWAEGRRMYIRRLAKIALQLDIRPPCMTFVPSGEYGSKDTELCDTCGYTKPQHARDQRRGSWMQEILMNRHEYAA